jgi:hypothetical protein
MLIVNIDYSSAQPVVTNHILVSYPKPSWSEGINIVHFFLNNNVFFSTSMAVDTGTLPTSNFKVKTNKIDASLSSGPATFQTGFEFNQGQYGFEDRGHDVAYLNGST